jgi:hypothetical protein
MKQITPFPGGLKISIGTLVEANLISEPHWIERMAVPRDPRRLPLAVDAGVMPKSLATPASVGTWWRSALSGPPEPEPL